MGSAYGELKKFLLGSLTSHDIQEVDAATKVFLVCFFALILEFLGGLCIV